MCFFPTKIKYKDTFGKFQTIECGCGHCPECLSKRSRVWALRSYYESLDKPCMMLTLTYDQFVYNSFGRVIGERLPDSMTVSKRDCQLFIKRLRKYISTINPDIKIKYLLTAEYGKNTHRPHYHCIIFGYVFDDCIFHKYSKRRNAIYRSETLNKIWGNGICTVDSLNITPAVARYCTKYCSKDYGVSDNDCFMLFSRDIGTENLLKDFNGLRYVIDGQDYAIPKNIWQKVLSSRYCLGDYIVSDVEYGVVLPCSYKYRGREYHEDIRDFYFIARQNFAFIRDRDIQYQNYLAFWRHKATIIDKNKPDVLTRITQLDNKKYLSYKSSALKYYNHLQKFPKPLLPVPRKIDSPLSLARRLRRAFPFQRFDVNHVFDNIRLIFSKINESHLPEASCHIRANDTEYSNLPMFPHYERWLNRKKLEDIWKSPLKNSKTFKKRLTFRTLRDRILTTQSTFALQLSLNLT